MDTENAKINESNQHLTQAVHKLNMASFDDEELQRIERMLEELRDEFDSWIANNITT